MTRIFTLIIVLFISKGILGQDLMTFSQSNRFVGKGKLADLTVTMTLDFVARVNYSNDGCISKYYSQIIGKYSYDKNGGGISIVGEHVTWTSELGEVDSLLIFELNSNFEKTAIFKGRFTDKGFLGDWENLKNGKTYKFDIIWTPSSLGNLKVKWKGKDFVLPEINIDSYQGNYQLIDKIETDNKLNLVITGKEPCCGIYNCRGTNCGGDNEYLYLFTIEQGEIRYQRELINSGCDWTEVIHTSKGSDYYSLAIENSEGQFLIKILYNELDKGIIKQKVK